MKIRLPRGMAGEANHVIVSVNGRRWQIMRGVEVDVPDMVGEVVRAGERARREAERFQERVSR